MILGVRDIDATAPKQHMTVVVCFDDTREAAEAEDDVSMINPSWSVSYVSQAVYANAVDDHSSRKSPVFDGQLMFHARNHGATGRNPFSEHNNIFDRARDLAKHFGDVLAFRHEGSSADTPTLLFHVEYFKLVDADEAYRILRKDRHIWIDVSLTIHCINENDTDQYPA